MDLTRDRRFCLVVFALVLVSLVLASAPGPAAAQEWSIRFDGRVQWVAGQLMVVDSDFGSSITVDLLRVPQGELSRSQTSSVFPKQARLTTLVSTCGPSRHAWAAVGQRLR